MFHGFERFLHRPVDKLACPGDPRSIRQRGLSRFPGPFAGEGAGDVPEPRRPGMEFRVNASLRPSHFGFRPFAFFVVIGSVLVSLLVLARRALP